MNAKKSYLKGNFWLTFEQVTRYEGWNSQLLLEEMQTRTLKLKERHPEKEQKRAMYIQLHIALFVTSVVIIYRIINGLLNIMDILQTFNKN